MLHLVDPQTAPAKWAAGELLLFQAGLRCQAAFVEHL
jgi:hypothetical protein